MSAATRLINSLLSLHSATYSFRISQHLLSTQRRLRAYKWEKNGCRGGGKKGVIYSRLGLREEERKKVIFEVWCVRAAKYIFYCILVVFFFRKVDFNFLFKNSHFLFSDR